MRWNTEDVYFPKIIGVPQIFFRFRSYTCITVRKDSLKHGKQRAKEKNILAKDMSG